MALLGRDVEHRFASEVDHLIADSQIVVVHSALWGFGHQFDCDIRKLPARLISIFLDVLGARRSLAFSTYSFSFCGSHSFDLTNTRSEVGVLSEVGPQWPGAHRTHQPIYSYSIIGPHADSFLGLHARTAWGPGSAMERFEILNARQL